MFHKLILQNFECHRHKKVVFKKNTVIAGRNDIGKSAIIRALHWICFNTRSFSFKNDVRHGAKFCRVVLYVDDHKITRFRSKSKNYYLLDGKKYKAMGNKVPSVIAEVLNLGNYNFQMQLDMPFWVSETPGKVSQKLNELVSLDVMDVAIKEAVTLQRDCKYDLQAVERLLSDLQATKPIANLPNLKKCAEDLLQSELKLQSSTSAVLKLRESTRSLESETSNVERLTRLVLSGNDCLKSLKNEQSYTDQMYSLNKRSWKLEKASRIALFASENVNLAKLALNNLRNSCAILERFRDIVNPISMENDMQASLRQGIEQCLKNLQGKRCPVCRSKISLESHGETCI